MEYHAPGDASIIARVIRTGRVLSVRITPGGYDVEMKDGLVERFTTASEIEKRVIGPQPPPTF